MNNNYKALELDSILSFQETQSIVYSFLAKVAISGERFTNENQESLISHAASLGVGWDGQAVRRIVKEGIAYFRAGDGNRAQRYLQSQNRMTG